MVEAKEEYVEGFEGEGYEEEAMAEDINIGEGQGEDVSAGSPLSSDGACMDQQWLMLALLLKPSPPLTLLMPGPTSAAPGLAASAAQTAQTGVKKTKIQKTEKTYM